MDKKISATCIWLLVFHLAISPLAYAAYDWGDKLTRGVANVATCFFEIPREIHFTSNEKNIATGWTVGLARGVGFGLMRLGTGLVDVVTAPFDFPDPNKAPVMQPEYPWQAARTHF